MAGEEQNERREAAAAFDPQLGADTLRGDIRDAVLAEFKHIDKPWQKMNEDEQQRLINRAENIGKMLVVAAIDVIAARDLPSLPVKVGKIVLEGAESDDVRDLAHNKARANGKAEATA